MKNSLLNMGNLNMFFSPKVLTAPNPERYGKIARQIAIKMAMMVGITLTLLILIIGLLDYRNQTVLAEEAIDNVEESLATAIGASLWDYNTDLLRIQIDGITNHPAISYAAVSEAGSVITHSGELIVEESQIIERRISLVNPNSNATSLGELHVIVDLVPIRIESLKRLIPIFISTFLLIIILAWSFFTIFEKNVAHYLVIITDYLSSLSVKKLDKPLYLAGLKNEQNELTMLTDAINLMQKQLLKSNQELEEHRNHLEERVKEEVRKNEYQQHKIFQQSRLAKMGEMISMIAHQWRQPLATISVTTMSMQADLMLSDDDSIDKELSDRFNDDFKKVNELVQSLSHTIDDFSNFYKPNQKPKLTTTKDVCKKAINIIKSSLDTNNINIVQEYNSDEEIELYDSDMMQVILNILKNAQENFQKREIENRKIIIKTQNRTISICDNGKGIDEDIIDRVFDPYFSTKDEKNGVGLSLYMSKTIIENHHNGKFSIENTDDGVCFTIELGIILDNWSGDE